MRSEKFDDDNDDDDDDDNNNNNMNSVLTILGPTFRLTLGCRSDSPFSFDIINIVFFIAFVGPFILIFFSKFLL